VERARHPRGISIHGRPGQTHRRRWKPSMSPAHLRGAEDLLKTAAEPATSADLRAPARRLLQDGITQSRRPYAEGMRSAAPAKSITLPGWRSAPTLTKMNRKLGLTGPEPARSRPGSARHLGRRDGKADLVLTSSAKSFPCRAFTRRRHSTIRAISASRPRHRQSAHLTRRKTDRGIQFRLSP